MPLLQQEEKTKNASDCLASICGWPENRLRFNAISAPGTLARTATARMPSPTLKAEAGTAAVAVPVSGLGSSCNAGASIDPFLAATLLQHLCHIQHNKDPELLSRLLASISAAAASYGQQQRMQRLFGQTASAQVQGNRLVRVQANSAGSRLATSVESVEPVAATGKEIATTAVAAASLETLVAAVPSAANRAALHATGAAVRRRCGFPIGTHELRESWAQFASAAITAADAFSPRWKNFRETNLSGPTAEPSGGQYRIRRQPEKAKLHNDAGLSRSQSQPSSSLAIPTDKDTIRRLKDQGLHRDLLFVTLPWSSFVSQYRKVIDIDAGRPSLGSNDRRTGKGRVTGNGFVPAGAEVTRTVTQREVRRAGELFLDASSFLSLALEYFGCASSPFCIALP